MSSLSQDDTDTTEKRSDSSEIFMPVWGHLDELRSRLIRCLLAVFAGICVTYWFSEPIVAFLEVPLKKVLPEGQRHLYFTGVSDKFMVYLKVAALSSLILVFPYILLQVWKFLSPGLYRKERRFLIAFVCFGSLAFVFGVAFGYGVILPLGYKWLLEFGSPDDKPWITLTDYFSLTFKILCCMGAVFELPILMGALGWMGVIDWRWLHERRKYAIFGSAVLAAVFTPTNDVLTMLLVFGVLLILFEVGLIGMRLLSRRSAEAAP